MISQTKKEYFNPKSSDLDEINTNNNSKKKYKEKK